MSHGAQIEFVKITKSLFPAMFVGRKVLEIGSLDINGTTRSFFVDCDYTGLDVAPGPGVDVVCQGQDYDAPSALFDVVVSCEVMEHNPYWVETINNMMRLLRPGGLMVMSCATAGRPEHGTSRTDATSSPLTVAQGWEYYRNLTAKEIVDKVDFSAFASSGFATNWDAYDLYFLGVKLGGDVDGKAQIAEFQSIYSRRSVASWYRRAGRVALNPLRIVAFLKRKTGLRNVAKP